MSSLDNIMDETFEFEGSTVKDAIKTALVTLGVSRKDVVVRIVCEEKKGLFGMEGAKPAKIKVTKKIRNKT